MLIFAIRAEQEVAALAEVAQSGCEVPIYISRIYGHAKKQLLRSVKKHFHEQTKRLAGRQQGLSLTAFTCVESVRSKFKQLCRIVSSQCFPACSSESRTLQQLNLYLPAVLLSYLRHKG
jgi:hypothetical protein